MTTPITSLGTPCSANWNETWIEYVDAVEADLGHRICGARTRGGDCCCMAPTHSNGRCRFHGGIDAYGGKDGNTHALRTGLYSFRLRPCSVKCPMWDKCPFAGNDVMQLPDRDRPACVYEQQEYDDAIAEVTALAAPEEDDGPETIAARESLTRVAGPYAMARVMTLRASMVLAEESLVNVRHVPGELPHSRVSGHAEVYLRLDRALRAREHHITQAAATIARTRRQQAEREAELEEEGEWNLALDMLETIEEIEEEERKAKEKAQAEAKENAAAPVNPAPLQRVPSSPSRPYGPSSPLGPSTGPSHSSHSSHTSHPPAPPDTENEKPPKHQAPARPTRRRRSRRRSRPEPTARSGQADSKCYDTTKD